MNDTCPKFSVITPSFNQAEYLEATIEGVLSQEGNFYIEYIIMDGNSTDDSINIIKKYDSFLKSGKFKVKCKGIKFLWESRVDKGQYDALNKGFNKSTGQILCWINSDDTFLPSAFKTVAMIYAKFPTVKWITANSTRINTEGMIIDVNTSLLFPRSLIKKGFFNGKDAAFIQQECTFWKRCLWNKLDRKLNTDYRYAGDFDLWTRFAEHAELVKVNTQLGVFRKHDYQKTSNLKHYNKEIESIVKVSLFGKLFMKVLKLFSRVYLIDKFYLLNHTAYAIYYCEKKNDWIMKKVKGRIY